MIVLEWFMMATSPPKFKRINDIPFDAITQPYYSSKNLTQASKILSEQYGFTDRAFRYFFRKLEVRNLLQPERMAFPSKRHIDSVNEARAKVRIEPSMFPPTLHEPVKKKKIEEDNVMVTVHIRAESQGLGGRGFHPIYLEASFSKILPVSYTQYDVRSMFGYLKEQVLDTPNYGSLNSIIEVDDSFVEGVEVERISDSRHRDGEMIIPLKPRRSR